MNIEFAALQSGLSGGVDVSGAAAGCALQLHPTDRGFYCYVTGPGPDGACAAALAGGSLRTRARPTEN